MKHQNDGSITLEATLSLLLFIFLILTLYSFFIVFEAQGKIQSTLIRTAESMSLDTYIYENVNSNIFDSDSVNALFTHFMIKAHDDTKSDFGTSVAWYEERDRDGDGRKEKEISAELTSVIEKRFYSYLANGNEDTKQQYMKRFRIKDQKLDFSESVLDKDNRELNLVVNYELTYFFDYSLFKLKPIKIKQKATSKLWM